MVVTSLQNCGGDGYCKWNVCGDARTGGGGDCGVVW